MGRSVLERNDVVNTTITVAQAGGGSVTLSETGPRHRLDWTYDATSGILSAMSISQQIGLGTTVLHVQLARRP